MLLDRRLLVADAAAFAGFLDVLDNPPPPTEKLRRLLKTKALWET